MKHPLIVPVWLILAALVLFQIVVGVPLLSGAAPYWIEPKGDMATMMAGHWAVIDQGWRWPPTTTIALRGPETPLSIVYTDSLPWLTLAMKALGIGRSVNVLALFMLLSYIAQPLAMVALLRASGVTRPASLLVGGLIALLAPVWLVRQFGHIALGGHWLLILALAWSVQVARVGLTARRGIEIVALGFVAIGTHPYHLPPLTACLVAGLVAEGLQRRAHWPRQVAATAGGYGLALALAAWILGFSSGQGQSGGGGALGLYSMNILGPIWPQASTLFGQTWDGRWFTGTLDANGGQTFEGFAYLGGGVVLLLMVAAFRGGALLRARATPTTAFWLRFGPLVAAMVFLTLYAIGPKPYLGMRLLFDLPRPTDAAGDLIGMFRAHGRFFWTVAYALLALGVVQVDKIRRDATCTGLLSIAIVLQIIDVSQLILGVRDTYKPIEPVYDRVIQTDPAFEGRPWRFQPLVECVNGEDGWTIVAMSAQALRRHGTSNSGPTARALPVDCKPAPEALVNAAPDDRTITVVVGDPRKDVERFKAFAGRTDCYAFKRGLLCGRDLEQALTTGPSRLALEAALAERIAAAPPIALYGARAKPSILGKGWSQLEPAGTWTEAKTAILNLPPADTPKVLLAFEVVSVGPSKDGTQRVQAAVEGKVIASGVIRRGQLVLPLTGLKPGQPTQVELRLPDAAQPPPFNGVPDYRLLAMGVESIRIVPLEQ